jgi:phage tail tape-measure protein
MLRNDTEKRITSKTIEDDENRDPITGTPGAHPLGVGAGAAGAGATGALIGGAVAGPIGATVGAVVGAVAGGLAGKGAAEAFNPTVEHDYWRGEYSKRPYVAKGSKYDQYAPAYQYGWESYTSRKESKKSFDDSEPELRREWEGRRDSANLSWNDARNASRDA